MDIKECYVVHGEEGECGIKMISEWIVSRGASEGGDGGGKVWARQKSVVMMMRRRKKERRKKNNFSM